MGTVRGTFDLNSRPASSGLREIRKEGAQTDVVLQRVGRSMDKIGTTRQRQQLRLYRDQVKGLGMDWQKTATKQTAAWDRMERKTLKSVTKQSAAVDVLQSKVNELGRSRPTVEIELDGIARSLSEVELLHKRLNALDRSRPTPTVGVGGTVASGLAARAAGGGGGGSGAGIRSMTLGPLSLGRAGFPIVIGGAMAAAPPLIGGAGAVLGSAGAATLGAGALGVGGLGALATGVGTLAAVAIPAIKGLKESSKALEGYNKAVSLNGRNSTEAHTALAKLNSVLREAPSGTRKVLNERTRLGERFQRLTKPAQGSLMGSLSNFLGAGNRLTPQIAGIANPLMAAGERQSDRLGNFLTGGTSRSFLGAAGNTAISVLPDVESTFQHVLATLMNISRASMPFFRQAVDWLETWTKGWADSTGDIDKTRRSIGGMVSQLKSWGRLTGATFNLLKDIFSAGAKPGQSMVDNLTRQMNTWDAWIKRNPRAVRQFFRDSVDSTEKIAGALGKITGLIWKLGQLLTPLLTQLSQFVGFLDSAGLLSPGGLPLLLAGGAGIRNMIGGARGRMLGGGGAAAGGMGLGEAALMGGALGGGGAAVARRGIFSRMGGFLGGVRNAGMVPVLRTAAGPLTMGMEADMGMIGARRFSMGAAAGAFGRGAIGAAAPGLGRFARGAGARFLPIAALMGGLSAASYPGDFSGRFQAGLSGLTAGIVKPPSTDAEKEDNASRHAQMVSDYYAERYGSGSLSGLRSQITALRRKRHRLLTPEERGGMTGFLTTSLDPFGGNFGHAPKIISDESRKEAEALEKQMEQVRAGLSSMSVSRGMGMGGQYRQAFQIRASKEGAQEALGDVTGPILANIKRLGPAGGRALAANVIAWTAAAKRQNPKLKKQYQELAEQIEASFARMGHRVRVINGEIYTGSRKEWNNIERAMKTPVARARAQMEDDFTAIQRQALNSLKAMGFSPSMAKKIVQGMESQNNQTRGAAEGAAREGPGGYNSKILQGASGPPSPGAARGMRIPGYGNTDHVPLAGGGVGAPRELIVNNHTEERANQILRAFGTSLEGMQRGEKYRQSTPLGQMYRRRGFARGGRGGIEGVGQFAAGMGLSVGEGPGFGGIPSGGHTGGSLHYSGMAYDVSGAPSLMYKFRRAAEQRYLGHGLNELFYDPYPYYIDNGAKVQGAIGGHSDHVHIGFFPGGATGASRVKGLMGGVAGKFKPVRAGKTDVGGAPGALAQRGMDAYAAGMNQKLRERAGMSARGSRGRTLRGAGNLQRFNRSYPEMHLGEQGPKLSAGTIRAIASWAGLPPTLFQQITLGESGGYPGMVGVDPGGTEGLGLWMITTGYNDALIRKLGGRKAMLNPLINARAAKSIYDSAGVGAWYGTSHVTGKGWAEASHARGGRIGWGGWNAKGGVGTFGRPTLLGVGEGMGKEDVVIRPHRPPGRRGSPRRRGGSVEVNFKGAHFHVRKDSDIDAIADKVGAKIAEAMEEDDGVDEEEVTG